MDIHKLYAKVSPIFRNRRFRRFIENARPERTDRLLDVGGYPGTWTAHEPCVGAIDILNVHAIEDRASPEEVETYGITPVIGDGCALTYDDDSYDLVFSNSVIEHVGEWEAQQRFAAEARRVGRKLWVQTPARSFFIEPHYITPFIHWLPRGLQKKLVRRFTVRGWIEKLSQEEAEGYVDEIRLLSRKQMKQLFPDCRILREPFLGVFTKSYIAFRDADAS